MAVLLFSMPQPEHLFQAKVSLSKQVVELHKKGRYKDAIPLAEKSRALSLQRVGDKHPDYATSLNNLASLYKSMGAYEKVEPLMRGSAFS